MKFIKPIDLWIHGDAILSGQIKLQRGQWVKCGPQLSRFVGVKDKRALWVAHTQGSKTETRRRFIDLCEAF
tara:strand:- start:179 stop:391 length:213 start_codon:yes stop_codon:yes gene_type:complete